MKSLSSIPKFVLSAFIALVFLNFSKAEETQKAKVFYAMETSSLSSKRTPNPAVVRRMVDNLVCAATGKPTPAEAWASLVKASDRVGIKVAASAGGVAGTHPAVVKAIAAGLVSAGVQSSNIIVWDRNLDGKLHRVRVANTALIKPAEFTFANGLYHMH